MNAMEIGRESLIDHRKVRDFGTCDERLTEQGWRMASIGGTHRDADTVDASNHRVLVAMLAKLDPDEEHHGIMHCGHWAVGWYDHVLIDPTCDALVQCIGECVAALDSYPILSDDDHSALECELHDDGVCGEHCGPCEGERQSHRYGDCHDDCKLCAEESSDE